MSGPLRMLRLRQAIFQYNQASNEQGGAIRAEDNSTLELSQKNRFSINSSFLEGGALYLDNLATTRSNP